MDKKQDNAKKTKLNVIDVIIIVAIVACIAAVGVRIYFTSHTDTSPDKVTVTYEVKGISEENAAQFEAGKKIYLVADDSQAGVFNTVNISPEKLLAHDESGKIVEVNSPDRKTVTGTLTFNGKNNDSEFMVSGKYSISLGSTVEVYTDRNTFTLTVIAIESEEK